MHGSCLDNIYLIYGRDHLTFKHNRFSHLLQRDGSTKKVHSSCIVSSKATSVVKEDIVMHYMTLT
jgi:hypothetical protein